MHLYSGEDLVCMVFFVLKADQTWQKERYVLLFAVKCQNWGKKSYKIPVDRYIHVYICTSVFSTVKYPSPGDPWPLDLSVLKFYQLLEWAKSFSLSTDQALIRCPVNEMELLPIAKTRQTILPSATALTRKSLFKRN